ncbi:MAG: shikimate dehydrogenase [Clostridiales bacterium]|nr:shikimate dehydrogenase [Clostridiales bacterium]
MSRKYALIGHPLGHTMSPFIHNRLFELAGLDAQYFVCDVAPDKLEEAMKGELTQYDGMNVTIPHKQTVIPFLDEIDARAKMYGAVNAICRGEALAGYNTDCIGFLRALEADGVSLEGNRVVVLGAGGVARAFAFESALAKADLTLAVRDADLEMANVLKTEIEQKVPGAAITICGLDDAQGRIGLLINATPLGMYPKTEGCAASDRLISLSGAVFDAVYNPEETLLLKKAKAAGAKAIGGMPMLVWQAVAAQEIWNPVTFPVDKIRELIRDANVYMNEHFQ